ncbi:substrate-binding domain-containing protein [Actinacidiphila oryziradicis]|uniref:Sugar ABC transporter substrate-binding protein n=1 Tax=Actinacidiphila oryziradicis TaxID=2571141 RepID=A0A4U0RXX1_9ACTN|nr:substrate-binding domain-containing protein [Actinacidiphila oryziradicis]MCW2875078.1 periplasmic binding protein/laci transcriptional regulator [Actinacidiphila oryziradicis]TKA01190.1 sugar ABC transporter substrate-binding protein [Actinacidiphila oryziradicis]
MSALSRRNLLFSGAAVGAGALVTGCTSNNVAAPAVTAASVAQPSGKPGKPITIGFSSPAADHGWLAAITADAQARAKLYPEVTFKMVQAGADATAQRAALETLIQEKPDIIVVQPFDGAQLTATGRDAMNAGIPVVNLDREFTDQLAYRLLIQGDNYGLGAAAGHYIGTRLKSAGKSSPIIAEIAGIDSLPLTQARSKGYKDALATHGFSVSHRVAAQFTVDSGQQAAANLLQAAPKLDAIWNHDDDQGVGVLAAISQAHRSEFFMVGGAGSSKAMQLIQADNSVLKATVTYSPTMAGSAVSLARLIANNRGMSDLMDLTVPKQIVLSSETVTKENVAQYLPMGF